MSCGRDFGGCADGLLGVDGESEELSEEESDDEVLSREESRSDSDASSLWASLDEVSPSKVLSDEDVSLVLSA